jgi:hypothetical protein
VFGLGGDPDAGVDAVEPLPLVRVVEDWQPCFPAAHKTTLMITALPDSLHQAVLHFILVCACRRARGQTDVHNSMLVHVTRFVAVQAQVAARLREYLEQVRLRVQMGEGDRTGGILAELAQKWETEVMPTCRLAAAAAGSPAVPTWPELARHLAEAVGRIEVRELNGNAPDALDYVSHTKGLSVIAVGGDKLSRGLTLEGLSVSYFLRASRMYDTLMQMGRWFGYREGYLDLCRLYTSDELCRWYRHITEADEELRREFIAMERAGMTPRNYGLRVKEHPGGLLVTAMNKMGHSRTQKLSYAGTLVQTSHFQTDATIVTRNRQVVGQFLGSLGLPVEDGGLRIWSDVPAERVLDDLLTGYGVAAESWRFQHAEVMEFIRRQKALGELVKWTVALVDTQGQAAFCTIGRYRVRPAVRAPQDKTWADGHIPEYFATRNSNIQSPNHQALDLERMPLTSTVLAGLLAKRCTAGGGALFAADEAAILQECARTGATLAEAARRVSQLRWAAAGDTSKAGIHGAVARQLRPKTHGLLTIYPIVPRDRPRWPADQPFVGLVLSFPASDTALAVDYKVNKVWQDTWRDEEYDDED